MAHHPHLAHDSAAIFSPSVARIAASNARDWSYVDSWLASKFLGRSVPPLERNPDTLKALLALASFNEAADEERQLVSRAEGEALLQIDQSWGSGENELKDSLLSAIEDELPREGQVALDSMADIAVRVGIAFPEHDTLGSRIADSQRSTCEAEQMHRRVEILHGHIENETASIEAFLRTLSSDQYKPPPDLAKRNLEMQRKVKSMSAQLLELQDRATALASSAGSPRLTINDVAREEQEYLAVLARKKQLDLQIAAFEGLPSDPDLARSELEALRGQLRGATCRRDAVFEGLVERESPAKRRH
ncbi:hypothetical protein ACO1O0_007381 [Amphichorda felina]